jgi:hypothetical protein
MTHVVEDLFGRPVSELLGEAVHSLNRFPAALAKSCFLYRLIIFLRDGTDGAPDKITPGSLPPASFSVRQSQGLTVNRNVDSSFGRHNVYTL